MGNRRALKMLALFFVMMLVLSLVARAADTLTIALVTVGTAKSSALTHETQTDARVEAERGYVVWSERGLGVERVPVKAGARVLAGDVLAVLSAAHVQRALEEKQTALDKLENSRAQAALDESAAKEEKPGAKDAKDEGKPAAEAAKAEEKERVERKKKLAIEAIDMEIVAAKRAASRLAELYRNGCALLAPADGVVTQMNLKAGGETGNDAAALVSDERSGLHAVAALTEEQARFVEVGDKAKVSRAGKQESKEADVESVSPLDETGKARATLKLADGLYTVGGTVSIKFAKKTDNFRKCVPLSALHSDSNGDFLLVLRETNGVLGVNQTASRLNVTVLDRDGTRAAVDGALMDGDKVIESSDKAISDGDRVRCVAP